MSMKTIQINFILDVCPWFLIDYTKSILHVLMYMHMCAHTVSVCPLSLSYTAFPID